MNKPDAYRGRWLAWDVHQKNIIAAADTYSEIMKLVTDQDDVVVEKAPGLHPTIATRPFTLLEDETANIIDDVRKSIPDPDNWLDTPNTRLWCQKPRELVGTPEEKYLRYLIRGIKSGITS